MSTHLEGYAQYGGQSSIRQGKEPLNVFAFNGDHLRSRTIFGQRQRPAAYHEHDIDNSHHSDLATAELSAVHADPLASRSSRYDSCDTNMDRTSPDGVPVPDEEIIAVTRVPSKRLTGSPGGLGIVPATARCGADKVMPPDLPPPATVRRNFAFGGEPSELPNLIECYASSGQETSPSITQVMWDRYPNMQPLDLQIGTMP